MIVLRIFPACLSVLLMPHEVAADGRQAESLRLAERTGSTPLDTGETTSPRPCPAFTSSVGEHFESGRAVRECATQVRRHCFDYDYYASRNSWQGDYLGGNVEYSITLYESAPGDFQSGGCER